VGLKRLLFLVVLAAAMSLGLASSAPAGNFDEERMGCVGEAPARCPTGTEGVPYSIPIELQGDEDEQCAVYSRGSGTLPPGLSISGARISGTPTQAGSFDFFLVVNYDAEESCRFEDPPGSGQFRYKTPSDDEFRIAINPGLAKLTLGPETTSPATVGSPYSLQMTASVGDPKTWSIASGSLPPGLSINPSSGLISGTPTAGGEFGFTVHARVDADGRSDTKALGIVVRNAVSIAASDPFGSDRRAVGEVSAPFEAMFTATGGNGTYTWSVSSGTLPAGLLFAQGAISGTPRTAGSYAVTVTATDSEGRVANYASRIVVMPQLAISTRLVKPGRVGKFFQRKLATLGGVKPAEWRLVRGRLPRGVFFDRTVGVLYGYPTRFGAFRVTFEATDTLGVKATKTLRIVIAPALKPKKRSG
jgi:hypothetical protein